MGFSRRGWRSTPFAFSGGEESGVAKEDDEGYASMHISGSGGNLDNNICHHINSGKVPACKSTSATCSQDFFIDSTTESSATKQNLGLKADGAPVNCMSTKLSKFPPLQEINPSLAGHA